MNTNKLCVAAVGLSVAAFVATMVLSSMAAADIAKKSDPDSEASHSRSTTVALISVGMLLLIGGMATYLYLSGSGMVSLKEL